MAKTMGAGRTVAPVVERIAEYGRAAARDRADTVAGLLRAYYSHVDPSDLEDRRVEDLFGAAADHEQLGMDWERGTVAMSVVNPRVEIEGWGSEHTVVMIVTDDIPFLVDSVTMELSRLDLGIHLVVHPVLVDRRADGGGFASLHEHPEQTAGAASFIAIEIDRQAGPGRLAEIERNLRRVLDDVRAAVRDWLSMRTRMRDLAAALETEPSPLPEAEVEESRQLLDWLADEHFTFLGYREYELAHEGGVEVLRAVPDSGLGILRDSGNNKISRPLSELAPEARERIRESRLMNLTKTGSKATIHRASYMDYIGVKSFDDDGNVVGERRFLGLFSAEVYNRSVMNVPRVRRLVAEVIERAGYPKGGHDEKRLLSILESYPRDELFQIGTDELYDISIGIAGLQERRRARLFARAELFGRFVTCVVYLPRDRYNTASRTAIQDLLLDAYGGTFADWSTQITDSVLARTVFLVRVESGVVKDADVAELEGRISAIISDWDDDFSAELIHEFGEDVGVKLGRTYGAAFPPEYRGSFDCRSAVADVHQLEALDVELGLGLNAYREPGQPGTAFKLKLYRRGARISLTTVMPTLTNLGVTVVDERPYAVRPEGREPIWIYDFSLEHRDLHLQFAEIAGLVEEAFAAVWAGSVADDGFNRLVLAAGMKCSDIAILRVYARYLHQIGVTHSQRFIERTFDEHPMVARMLTDLFWARFDPDHPDRETSVVAINHALFEAIDAIESLEQDRLLRRFQVLIGATLRTSFFQVSDDGRSRPYIAFKFDPTSIDDLPDPRPQFEIFVYSPRFEGVHLRAGSVARGGLRWSERDEDFRTEVLGLVKAQMVKNAVIVPAGAKGGFVLKRPPPADDAAALREEVVACYQLFVSGLLDLTDNLEDSGVIAPARTVRYDGDDPYLVVAADKGTATFSDIANELATGRGFWLGDAFASGGSNGYDHKAMGITARGAWESVKRHFRELGRDIQSEGFTAVGIGDMSGDVFGNGMLLSPQTRLIAAFDHRHVFVDPQADARVGFEERQRLFEMPRSSWADYDTSLISSGGGVYERTAKSIELSDEARQALGIGIDSVTPNELISAVLLAPVDLLWNGGIGTYVKASDELHSEVGDKANDAIRVDGIELRCKVIGEGGNLGVTQRGRIEFARREGRVYTDAIDNAGGVDCSDHEVNIKILLDRVVADGDMTAKQRNKLLDEMTDEVAALVLADNYGQTQALSNARVEAASMVDVHARYLEQLEGRNLLDRELEALPDGEGIAELRLAGRGLVTPELAIVLAYTKNILNSELLQSDVPDDEVFEPLLIDYFPTPLRERFVDRIKTHQLRREIIANAIANLVVNRGGTSLVYRLAQETSAPTPEVAAAHMAAWEIFELGELTDAVNALDNVLPTDRQISIHLAARQLAERATRLLLRNRPHPFSAADAIADLAAPVREATHNLSDHFVGADRVAFDAAVDSLIEVGTPTDLACRAAGLGPSVAALDIVEVAAEQSVPIDVVTAVHFAVADRLDLTWLRDRILDLPRDSQWATLSRLTLRGDLYTDHRMLTAQVTAEGGGSADPIEWVDRWIQRHVREVARYRQTIAEIQVASTDLTTLLVAAREVRNLISRTGTVPAPS